MKKIILIVSLLIACTGVHAQGLWGSEESVFAQHRYYASVGIGWVHPRGGGNVFSVAPEFGHILDKHFSVGVSGRFMVYASEGAGTVIDIHPYFRLHTSFPTYVPNLYADIGYDFRRRAYDNGAAPGYYHDFGIRPGFVMKLADHFLVFFQIGFLGYQWSRVDGKEAASWKAFRFDNHDHGVGFSFCF